MELKRGAGVLLNISSLPGPYGIGVFGEEAKDFLQRIAKMGFTYWQVLPFQPVDPMHSPYTSCSAFAGNWLYIDPRGLVKEGLLTQQEAQSGFYPGTPYTADYEFAGARRLESLRLAFSRLGDTQRQAVEAFAAAQKWLPDFALYQSLKGAHGQRAWWEWGEYAQYSYAAAHREEFAEETAFWEFVQFVFFSQWEEIKSFAKEEGVSIIGDMPIYVARDSCDLWSNLPLFLIDAKTLSPQKVAGVPPDYFSEDGQLWGNPLYDWDAMKADGYRWWVDRIGMAFRCYDIVRIDHFRAFASYWSVPAEAKTAKEGEWVEGPGHALFEAIAAAYPDPAILAEDLGVFGEDVVELLEFTDFPGMRVIQFGFDPDSNSTHLPHNYPQNCIAYAGTHDNNTLLGWLWEATPAQRQFALDYCGFEGKGDSWSAGGYQSASCRKILETVWRSPASIAIASLQDLCGFGSDARMNVPGVPEHNWLYRAAEETLDHIDSAYYTKINRLFSR